MSSSFFSSCSHVENQKTEQNKSYDMDFHDSSPNNGKAKIPEDLASFWCNDSEKEEVFGRKVVKAKVSENPMMTSSAPRRQRSSNQNSQISRCQVEGCNIDLSSAKDYHRRHRICECHSKSPKVIVAGFERRFCQQCSRFHGLVEFDDKKRSCRRRLSDHNARRRRPHHSDISHMCSSRLTSSIYERRPSSFLVNRLASSLATTTTWESSRSSKMTLAESALMRGSGNGASSPSTNSHMNEAQHFPVALSLLSSPSNSWELSQPKSSSSLHNAIFMHQNNSSSIGQQPIPLESQNWPLYPPQNVSAEQAYSISPL